MNIRNEYIGYWYIHKTSSKDQNIHKSYKNINQGLFVKLKFALDEARQKEWDNSLNKMY